MSDHPESHEHKPWVPPEKTIPELTVPAVAMGAILGIVFAASSTYLGLKVGLTVSASIPVAVLSITLFRWLKLRGTILENNIAQTTGSAGESLAAGVAFTLPSLLLMGFEVELLRVLLVALLGGLIGVLMMIPLRHGLIVKEHGKLTYPEGTACADVLIVGEKGGTDAKNVFLGFFVGLFYGVMQLITKFWSPDGMAYQNDLGGHLKKASIEVDTSAPMLGVGYIIGPKVAANMLGGGILAFLVLIPLIAMFGGDKVAAMSPHDIRGHYVLYIGAGAVAAGGFIALGRSIPTIVSAFRRGLGNIKGDDGAAKVVGNDRVLRTERDLPMTVVLGGSAVLAVAIFAAPILNIDFLTALLVVVFGFFFVTVSSRITGEIGSSSNPISGMTIATLLLTCGLFVLIGRTGVGYKAMALSTAALVCVAASNGGTISQDLKTGYLVGATPRLQQIAIAIGVISSAIVIGFVMLLFLGTRNTYQVVDHPGVHLTVTAKTAKAPDGKVYQVAWVRDHVVDTGGDEVIRGKYLVDEQGTPMFFVSTSVDQGYPWKLKARGVQLPAGMTIEGKNLVELVPVKQAVTLPPVATTATGPDGKPYRLAISDGVHVSGKETVPAGTYLVDDAGVPRFRLASTAEPMSAGQVAKAKAETVDLPTSALTPATDTAAGPDSGSYRLAIVSSEDPATTGKGLDSGTYLIDASGQAKFRKAHVGTVSGTDLGWDRKRYNVVDLESGVGPLGKGHYLISDTGYAGYERLKVSKFDAPKAQLFALIIDGTLGGNLPWGLVLIGVFIAIILELLGVSSLPFAVGLYLPIATSGGIFVGGVVRTLVDRQRKGESAASAEFSPGMLMASGLIAGGSIAGVIQAGLLQFEVDDLFDFSHWVSFFTNANWWPLVPFAFMAIGLYYVGTRKGPDQPR
ncbi:MAG TPA: oligopeptide transporter, OPT family [Kofleriaceae bacterium]|nr:oligopeptide transporter, OPT family [Kofleriaceae bacterium]